LDGVDHGYTGLVRRIDEEGIRQRLDSGTIVLLSPIGYSMTGEVFNVSSHEVATAVAVALGADKLIVLAEGGGLSYGQGHAVKELNPLEARDLAASVELEEDLERGLLACTRACEGGVRRAHLLDRQLDGALLGELFTLRGSGTLVTRESFDGIRPATLADVTGILDLISPLAEEGVLRLRPRELLENEIQDFVVIERDGLILACAALHLYSEGDAAELAAVVVDRNHRVSGRGDRLVQFMERRALERGVKRLFVLTTRTAHWFLERGYELVSDEALPSARRGHLDRSRGSKILLKALD
jgi:amino-acid N-acetyltransferase